WMFTLFACIPTIGLGFSPGNTSFSNHLFGESDPLELILYLDMQEVLNDKSDEPLYSPAFLIRKIDHESIRAFNIKVKARGKTRRTANICEFPPLKINFEKKSTEHTVFEGQDKVKLVTHCNESDDYQNYALLEYLAYRTYNTLTDYSYRVRLVNVTYKDIRQNHPDIVKSGFLIEDDAQLADRIGGEVTDKKIWSPDSCNQKAFDVFSLFQFMIGNTDWWVHTRHNVDLISLDDKELIPVPFDFDGAGIISTPYAMPSTKLPISRVKDRFFKGACRTIGNYEETLMLFNQKRSAIETLLENAKFLGKKYKKSAIKYVEDFYAIINNEEEFKKYLGETCDYLHTSTRHLTNMK
ncbi:MAG: hypothetical protein MI975_21055, partial [Cytophagales bacterium]|nr:hypothetical protein [Cytophagales bacterium]